MIKYCSQCKMEVDCEAKKCPGCGGKLERKYTEEELQEIQKQNEDFTVINTFLM